MEVRQGRLTSIHVSYFWVFQMSAFPHVFGLQPKARFLTIDLSKHSSDSLIAMFTEHHIVSAVSPNRGTVGALYERWRTYRDPRINVILDKAQYNKATIKSV